VIAAYLIFGDDTGELRCLPDVEAPPSVRVMEMRRVGFIDKQPEDLYKPVAQERWLNNTGYRYVGAVNQFAWVYQ